MHFFNEEEELDLSILSLRNQRGRKPSLRPAVRARRGRQRENLNMTGPTEA